MASVSTSRYLSVFLLLNLFSKCIAVDANLTFFPKNFGKELDFESQFALYGDAKVANDGTSVQISGSRISTFGRVICQKPIYLIEKNSRNMVSFANSFVFSLSSENGDGLAFVMLPVDFPFNEFDNGSMGLLSGRKFKFLAVEFDTYKDGKYNDVNGNHIGVDVESHVSVKVSNVSSIDLVLISGEKLQAWIDYEASCKRLEVRLSKLGDNRPLDPLLSYPIDLSKMWKGEKVVVGFSSSSGNSSQKSNLYSWSFSSRIVPQWMHSEPIDPENFAEKGVELKVPKGSDCYLRILTAFIFGTGCGALIAFFVSFIWTIFGNRRPVVPEEFAVQSKECEYKKFNVVVVDKTIEDGKV